MATEEDSRRSQEDRKLKLWGMFVFGLVGAAATTFAILQLRRNIDLFYAEMNRSQASQKASRKAYQEEARKRYYQHVQEEYEEKMERVERIRRMQKIFNRERNKHRKAYNRWKEEDSSGAYEQKFWWDDWYYNTNTSSFRHEWSRHNEAPRSNTSHNPLSHHYSILGLDRSREAPYTEAEVKKAFREKAMQFHPDQNQHNKEAAEAKFKEMMTAYEAIKQEHKNSKF